MKPVLAYDIVVVICKLAFEDAVDAFSAKPMSQLDPDRVHSLYIG